MQVRDIMTTQAEVIDPERETIQDAARKMQSLDTGFLPVCENDRLVGSITDRDIVINGLANGHDPSTTQVRDAMSPGILFANEDDDVEAAADRMREHRIRRLPVINAEKQLVGVVSLGDIAVKTDGPEIKTNVLEAVSQPS